MDWVDLGRYLRLLSIGAGYTLYLSGVTLILSTILALPLVLLSNASIPIVKQVIAFYSWAARGVPELIILLVAYLGLPQLGFQVEPMPAAILAFAVFSTAYTLEIFRGGFQGVKRGQYEAAQALGMSYPHMIRRIILPQVIRIILPSFATYSTTLLKRTSLASVVAVTELTATANRLIVSTYRPFEILSLAALLYILLNSALLAVEVVLQRRAKFEI